MRPTWTAYHRTVLFVAWLGWTFDVMDAALFNLAKQRMVTDLVGGPAAYAKVGPQTEAFLLNAFLVGWSAGGVFFGWLADKWGRVKVLTLTVLLYSLFTGLTALSKDVSQAAWLRLLTGLGIGGEWAAGAVLVAESVPEEARARAASWLQTAAAVGPILAALANIGLAGQSWRALFLVGVAPALLTVLVRGRLKEPERKAREGAELGRWPWKALIVGLALGTAGIAIAQNVSFWLPNLVSRVSPGITGPALQARQGLVVMSLHVGTVIGVFLIPWLCERLGRRAALLVCFVASPMTVLLVAWLAKGFDSLVCLAPILSVFSIGIGAGFVLYFPELFPPAFRATGAGLSYNGGRILAGFFPLLTAALIQGSHGDVLRSILQTSALLSLGALALSFSPETKGQRLKDSSSGGSSGLLKA